jgi:D-3-phosphoglycerate dehydrogenase
MEVVAADPYVDADEMADHGVESTTQAGLLSRAHVVSLHAPLIEDTRGLIDADALGRMRDDAVLVNVARGGLIDESALVEAIDEGAIAGAALDVFVDEPADQGGSVPFDHPLRGHDNVVLTPHVAWASAEADLERRRTAAEDVRRVLDGEPPENRVNDPR